MKKFLSLFLLCFFTLPLFANNTILIVGDSLSAGYGIDPNQGWVALLKNRLHEKNFDYDVINSSISGDTTAQGLARLPALLKQFKPQITIIELGGNDGLRGLPLAVIKQNLDQMIILIKSAESHPLILGIRLPPNYGAAYLAQFQKIFTDLSEQTGVSVVPLFLKNIDENARLMQPDHTHPTAAAQMILLTNVWPTLEELLNKS